MEFTTTSAEKSTVRLEVTLAVADVAAAIAQAVRHVAGHSRIPGFRPGKAPRSIVERFAGINRILDEATEILIERGYRDAIVKSDIVPLTSPKIDAKPIVEGEPYTFTAVIPVPPEVKLGDYRGYTFEPTFEEPDEAKVEAVVNDLRDSYATLTPVTDRGA